MLEMKKFAMRRPGLVRIWIWMVVLVLVILFWPRPVESEPVVVTETKIVYVYKESELPEEFKNDIPEEVIEDKREVTIIPEEVIIPLRYGFDDDEIYLMTVLLCGSGKTDGDGEYDVDFYNKDNHEQISLVLSIVMNRVMSDRFPNSVSEVIWARGQFSPMPKWKNGLPKVSNESYEIVKKWCEAYDAHDLSVMSIPESHLYFAGNGKINKSRERW